MSDKKKNKKNWDDKYRLVPDDVVKNLVEFLDEIQFDAAKESTSESIQVINLCNYLISQLINAVIAHPYKKYDRDDNISDHIIEFPEMDDAEFNKLVEQFDLFFKGWEKEYNKKKPKKKSKKEEDFKPKFQDVVEHCTLEEIKEMLLDDPELTPQERFELYYGEHERVNRMKKKKEKTYTLDELLKGTKIGRYKDK